MKLDYLVYGVLRGCQLEGAHPLTNRRGGRVSNALDLSTWYFSMRYLTEVAGMGSLDMVVDYAQAGVKVLLEESARCTSPLKAPTFQG